MPLAPNQLRLDDGFSTTIELSNLPSIRLFEKEVTPVGYSGGAKIDTTTMRNVVYKTGAPRRLKELTKMTGVVAYATEALPQIWDQINVNQLVIVRFPDGSAVRFWGWLSDFAPATHKEGEQPTATITVETGMRDADGNEVAPEYVVFATLVTDDGGVRVTDDGGVRVVEV